MRQIVETLTPDAQTLVVYLQGCELARIEDDGTPVCLTISELMMMGPLHNYYSLLLALGEAIDARWVERRIAEGGTVWYTLTAGALT